MGLKTENAGGLIGIPGDQNAVKVKFLEGTYVKSVGRDVQAGEVVAISAEDFRFLGGYKYCEKITEDITPDEKALGGGRK